MDIYEAYIENVILLAEEAMDDGHYQEARRLLDSGLAQEPGYAKLHAKMGELYHCHMNNLERAERHYQLAIRFDPKYKEAYEYLIQLYREHKKDKGIFYWMSKAQQVEELNKAFVFGNLGRVAEREKTYKKAIRLFKKALMESQNNYETDELKDHIKRIKYKLRKLNKKKSTSKKQ